MRKFLHGFIYAWRGLRYAFSTQINFRFHFFCGASVVISGLYFQLERYEWFWICLAIAMVFISELFNTAVEVLTDLVSPGYHPKAGIVKDLASGAVLITALFALITGLLIFIPKII